MRPLLILSLLLTLSPFAFGQASAALRDRVAQLVERLEAEETDARDKAETALIDLGARALPLLPEADEEAADDLKQRLDRVRDALQAKAEEQSFDASHVTIQGEGIRLSEVLRALQSQSGNPLTDLRELYGQDATNPALDLDIEDKPFFEALDEITGKAGLNPEFFTGDGTIGLLAGRPYEEQEMRAEDIEPLILYIGPFRIVLQQVALARNFEAGTHSGNLQFAIAWEPRLRPMLLALDVANVEIVDDQEQVVEPQVRQEAGSVVLRPDNPAAEMNLNIAGPDRNAQTLVRVRVKADVTVPSANQVFRFPNLAESNVTQMQNDIKVTLERVEVEDFVWKIDVEIAYPDAGGEAFESYRQGLFNNRLWLQRPDGSRFEHNGGFSQTGGGGGTLGFQYLFVDVPGQPTDYQFVYETPSRVLTIPLEFEFDNVPLP